MIATFYLLPKPYAVKVSAWFIRLMVFVPVRVKGRPDPDAQMYLINHQSDIDIGIMETITTKDLAWVAKKELFDVKTCFLKSGLSEISSHLLHAVLNCLSSYVKILVLNFSSSLAILFRSSILFFIHQKQYAEYYKIN